MTTPLRILAIAFFVMLLNSFSLRISAQRHTRQKNDIYIYYTREIGIMQTCDGQEVEILIGVFTESEKETKIYSYALENSDFAIYNDNKAITRTDTLVVKKDNPVMLTIKYRISVCERPSAFSFKTNNENYVDNKVNLLYGSYFISGADIREGKEQFIDITGCEDNVKIFFPYGGTVSGAGVYKDSSGIYNATQKAYKAVSYGWGDGGNSIVFSKAEAGRYYVRFGSCHWGNEFWMTIRYLPATSKSKQVKSDNTNY